MVRIIASALPLLFLAACGMGDACEELADARCECDEAMCGESESNMEVDDKRTQACKEELEDFTCQTD